MPVQTLGGRSLIVHLVGRVVGSETAACSDTTPNTRRAITASLKQPVRCVASWLRLRNGQRGANCRRGGRNAVGGAAPAEDVVEGASDPEHGAPRGAAAGEGQVTQQPLVATCDFE